MTFRHSIGVFLLSLVLSNNVAFSQTGHEEAWFSLLGSAGIAVFGNSHTTFHSRGEETVPLKPGIAGEVGASYGPFASVSGAQLHAAISVAYGRSGTGSVILGSSTLEQEFENIPIMARIMITTDEMLSPFVSGSAGVIRRGYKESSSNGYVRNVSFHEWQFSWGVGGGLMLRTSSLVSIAIFVDNWITESDLVEPINSPVRIQFSGRSSMMMIGIRGVFVLS